MLPNNVFQIILKYFQRFHSKTSYFLLFSGNLSIYKSTVLQKQKFVIWFPSMRKQHFENLTFFVSYLTVN